MPPSRRPSTAQCYRDALRHETFFGRVRFHFAVMVDGGRIVSVVLAAIMLLAIASETQHVSIPEVVPIFYRSGVLSQRYLGCIVSCRNALKGGSNEETGFARFSLWVWRLLLPLPRLPPSQRRRLSARRPARSGMTQPRSAASASGSTRTAGLRPAVFVRHLAKVAACRFR